MQVTAAFLNQWFGENVCKLFCSVGEMNGYSFILNEAPKVMILDSNVFCSRGELGALCDFDTVFVIFPDFAMEDRLG